MTYLIRNAFLFLLLVVAAAAYAGVPVMNVIVSDGSGRVAFKGATNAEATFTTGKLAAGNYVVQFNSRNAALKGNRYLLVVSAGQKKVIADAVAGEKLAGEGVAMKVAVGSEMKITGQIVTDQVVASDVSRKVKVINGTRYAWIEAEVGSNLGGHWEEESVAAAREILALSKNNLRQIQDRSFEGSLLNRHPHEHDIMGGRPF